MDEWTKPTQPQTRLPAGSLGLFVGVRERKLVVTCERDGSAGCRWCYMLAPSQPCVNITTGVEILSWVSSELHRLESRVAK